MTEVCIGNDVVDLERPRTVGRADDERFVTRVLAAEEQEAVRAAPAGDLELWCHWAAKEAGYKVISKLLGDPPPFVHREFRVAWRDDGDGQDRRGSVSWRRRRVRVSVALLPGSVHAVASAARDSSGGAVEVRPRVELLGSPATPWAGSLDELLTRLTEREAEAVYSLPSAAVRVGARGDLARHMGVSERRVEIVCGPGRRGRRPPRVLLDGAPAQADVSLSHDGRLIAWATWVGPNQGMP